MNLKEFREQEKTDRNLYWRLQDGERQNLLDEALGIVDEFEQKLTEVIESYEIALAEVSKVYDNLTNGKLSKPNYQAATIIEEVRMIQENELTEAIKQAKVEENERFKTNFVKAIESAQDHGNILFNELNKYKGFNDWVGKNNKYDADKEDLRRFIISCFKLFASEIKCKILEPESTN